MGLTFVNANLTGPTGKSTRVKFLVDSGASYSLLPERVWKKLSLKPQRKESFILADGTELKRGISECKITLQGRQGHTPVILGEPGDDQALLGVITLEYLGLVLDPFSRELHKMQLRLA